MPRATEPQVSFADWELMQQGMALDPLLAAISDLLAEHHDLIEQVRVDLQRDLKRPELGRDGLTPPQVLRALVLMRIKNWDYRELRERIADGYTLRCFTHFYAQPVPQHHAFNRAFNRLTPAVLQFINELVVQAAVELGLEDGTRLRVDTTVVQTEVHHPTDSGLLWDAVRVITRLVRRLGEIIPRGVSTFHNRSRAAKRRYQQIQRMTSSQRQTRLIGKYRELIEITAEVVQSAQTVLEKTKDARLRDVRDEALLGKLRQEITHYCQLGKRVLDQTRRRVLEGEQVPNAEKVFSLFEPHTDLIRRGKPRTPEEFGHKVFLAESAQGLITQYEVLDGNPADQHQVETSLLHHQATFDHPPDCYAADRGFQSVDNEKTCKEEGVQQISLPQRGGQKTRRRQAYEKTPAFKQGQRFRSGIEGRISVLFRGRGMKRCRAKGRERFEVFVGAAVLANNLLRIAALLVEKKTQKKKENSRRSKAAT
jgi:transposase, IS5 family